MILSGKVSEVASTHVSVLVYGIFNATVPRDGINSSYSFTNGEWINANGETISVGNDVKFKVLRQQHAEVSR